MNRHFRSPSHSLPSPLPFSSGSATPDPLQSGLDKVDRMIEWGRYRYPLASENLRHWRDGKGALMVMPASAFRDQGFIIEHLRGEHRPKFLEGARKRLADGRLAVGKDAEMEWTDSVYSPPFSDLYFALGGFTLHSKVKVEATVKEAGKTVNLRFTSWRLQASDEYDWDPGKSTLIPGIGRVTDDEMLALERAGHGRNFPVQSVWFDVTDPGVTASETIRIGS